MPEYTFFMVMLVFCVVTAVATLIYVIYRAFDRRSGEIGGWELRGAFGRILAVARITLAEGMRTKIAAGFAAIILISIPIFWLTATGDGTIKGRIQMSLAYSMGFTSFMLSLLTIFFSCRSLSMEVASRQIFSIVSKPVPRWQLLAGKWTGVMFLNVVLVALACTATYIGTVLTVRSFKSTLARELQSYCSLTAAQADAVIAALDDVKGVGVKGFESPVVYVFSEALGRSQNQVGEMLLLLPEATRVNLRRFDELRRQVLIARATVTPELPDFSKRVEEEYQKMVTENRVPEDWTPDDARRIIRAALKREFETVSFGMMRTWRLKGPKPEKGKDFLTSIRYRIRPSRFMVDEPKLHLEEETMQVIWGLGDPGPDPPLYYEVEKTDPVNTFNEFEIPADAIAPDGTVILTFGNADPRQADATFSFPWGLQVLYRVGSFELNLAEVGLAILIPLASLAAFGVCASTFLSFPVASLIVLTLFIITSSLGFVAESLGATEDYYDPAAITWDIQFRKNVVASLGLVLAIGDVDPVADLIEGRAIGWASLWTNTWKFVLVKGTLVMLLGVMIFRRRELAAIIV